MKLPRKPGILLVATRELRWMYRDKVALILAIGVPLLAYTLLVWTFSNAVIRELKVSVVDADRTSTSMTYVQAIEAAPAISIANRSEDLTGAMRAVRSGAAIAAVYIPANFERDLIARKRPQIIVFYNRQYLTPGNNASSAITSAIDSATATLSSTEARSASFSPGPLVAEQYVLTNPALNYVQFLLRAIMPMVLHVVIAIAAGYAIGSEFLTRSIGAWLRTSGGHPVAALVGKLLPLFGIFALMMLLESAVIHNVFQIAFRGNAMLVAAAAGLLLIAYLALGALLPLLTRNLALGLSLSAIICSPAFGFVGIGFPTIGMNTFARIWGDALPLRWYFDILFDQALRGLPAADSAHSFAILAAQAILLSLLTHVGLKALLKRRPSRQPSPAVIRPPDRPLGVVAEMFAEIRRVVNDSGARSLMIMGPVLYGLFYPQPYLGQVLRGIPIAVVDQDNSEISRNLIQTLNADEAISVAVRANTLGDAQAALARRKVFAIVGIPEGTEREVSKGNVARLAAYVDSTYFLLYSRTVEGIQEATAAVNAEIASHGARLDGSLAHAALITSSPVDVETEPLFNPTGGYASAVVPAAFLLIIQQTLLMGVATLGGVAFEQGGPLARRRRNGARAMIGHALGHLIVALPGLALYLIILPHVYGFSTLGHVTDLFVMAIPFILSISFMGQFVSIWFKRRETAVIILIGTSLPLFFLVGVSWPLEAIPASLRVASRIFPTTTAVDGLVRINQMGASLKDVFHDWMTLWALTLIYATLAIVAAKVMNRKELSHAQ